MEVLRASDEVARTAPVREESSHGRQKGTRVDSAEKDNEAHAASL